MIVEHVAWMVEDPLKVAEWYTNHLGFRVVRRLTERPWTHFLLAPGDAMMVEVYNNPLAEVPDYAAQDALVLHLAFGVDDVPAERDRLLAAGATIDTDCQVTADGDTICMMRDPWGFAIQLVKRAAPMLPMSRTTATR